MAGNNPTQVNIGIGLDMDALKKSVGLARGEVETFVRDIKKQQTDLATFNKKAAVADTLFTQGSISAQEHATAIAGLAKQYNQIGERGEAMFGGIAARLKFNEEALARTVDKQKQGLAMLELQDKVLHNMGVEEEKIVQAHIRYAKELGVTSPLMQKMADDAKRLALAEQESATFIANIVKNRIAMEQEKHAKIMADIAAEKLAEENSMIFLMELRKQQRIDEEQRHAKKVADLQAEKLAEENSMIFLMELRKQQRLDEEQRHAKRLAEIAAEKQAQATLGLNAYGTATPTGRASSASIDVVTGKVLEQKQETLSLDEAINKLENDHAADVKRHAEQNAAREKQLHQEEIARRKQAEQVHSQAIRKRQDEQRQADRDRFRSLLDQAKTHKQIVAESDRFIERMKQQYNLSDKLVKKLKEIERSRIDAGGRGVGGSGMAGGLTRNLGQFGTGVMAGFGVAGISSAASQAGQALGDFIADSVKLAMERQRISAAMEAMLGSEEAAQKLTKAMIQLDRQSMLTYGTISKGAQTLLGFGVAQEMVMPSLQALSKISLGNEQRFQSLSLAFGQVAASGKLAGQEILQMVNAGFNPLQEIARVTGKTVAQLKADVEAGRVSFLQVAEAILTATEAGGRFEKISEKMLKTPAGMLAKLQSDFELIKADLGERLMPSMIAMFESIKDNEFVMETLATNIANLFDTFGFVLSMIQDAKNLLTMGLGNAPALFSDESKSGQFMAQWEKRQEEMEKRRAEQKAQRDKKQAEEEAFKSLPPEERKKRLAEEQAKMDEFRADQQRAKSRAEMQKKLQELEDGSDRARYFREIGGHLAKTKDQIKLINDAMEEFDKVNELTAKQERSQNLHEEINSLQEEYNRLKMDEVDFMLRKYNLDKQQLTKEEQLEKSRLLKAKNRLDQEKRRKDWEEFGKSFNPANEATKRVRDIMLAVEYGFLDAAEAAKAQLEAVKDINKENQLSLENPKMMDLGRALIESQKAGKVQQTQEVMKQKLIEIAGHAKQQVDELKKIPGFAERN